MTLKFLRDERGATAIEYALIASLIGLVIITAVGAVGDSVTGVFNDAAAGLAG
jgi:pilus assembly protein Flp/PilA